MFQNRWGIVSEKVPTSWGNDSEKSQYGLQLQGQRGGKCCVYVARGAEERKSIAWLTLNSERRCVCATSLDRPHVVRGSVFGRDTLEMTAGSLVLNSWRREMRTFALTVGMLMALLVALTLGSNMAQAATTCEMVLDNNAYRCQVKPEGGGAFEDCFRFTSPGVQSIHFDLNVDGLGIPLGCNCKAKGNINDPQFGGPPRNSFASPPPKAALALSLRAQPGRIGSRRAMLSARKASRLPSSACRTLRAQHSHPQAQEASINVKESRH